MIKAIKFIISYNINTIKMMKKTGLRPKEWTVDNSSNSQSRTMLFE